MHKLIKLGLAAAGLIGIASIAAAGNVPGIGAQYFVYSLGTYNPEIADSMSSPSNNWYLPGQNFRTPVGLRHLNPTLVDQQLDNMRNSGIDILSIPLPVGDLAVCEFSSCNDGYADGVWGEVLDYSGYALRAQQQTNLRNIVRKARDRGFRYIFLRLNNYGPANWTAWNETEYQKAWNFIVNTRALVYSELTDTPVKVLFDLAPEMVGNNTNQLQTYTQRIWSDYVTAFGTGDTVGGSVIGHPSFLPGLSWFGATKPPIYAFDIYQFGADEVGTSLVNSWNSLPAAEKSKPIILMETYHNEAATSASLQAAIAANPTMKVMAIVQWPTTREPCTGCGGHVRQSAITALGTTSQISNYLTLAQSVVSDDSNGARLHFSDVNCATSAGTCTIDATITSLPAPGKPAYKVYLRSYTAPVTRTLMTCNAGTNTVTIPWIQPYTGYFFEYYAVNNCSEDPFLGKNPVPDATSVVTAR
ncbi:hypothetical protein [Tahibacter caeni]|uniref:hypothetical protein n=1 Tax=Tahibacter caeni TaxID=1453545 RepID=UPI002148A783|nr:hypothetical protein [Tahibacter caeni]